MLNIETGYKTAIFALRMAFMMGGRKVYMFTYFRLVLDHFGGPCETRDERMEEYLNVLSNYAK